MGLVSPHIQSGPFDAILFCPFRFCPWISSDLTLLIQDAFHCVQGYAVCIPRSFPSRCSIYVAVNVSCTCKLNSATRVGFCEDICSESSYMDSNPCRPMPPCTSGVFAVFFLAADPFKLKSLVFNMIEVAFESLVADKGVTSTLLSPYLNQKVLTLSRSSSLEVSKKSQS